MILFVLLHCLQTAAAIRHLLLFRAKSRHTYGFLPESFDLPRLEFEALVGNGNAMWLKQCDDPALCWAEGVHDETAPIIIDAAQRCVLLHSAFAIVASANSVSAAYAAAVNTNPSRELAPSDAEIVDLSRPELRAAERDAIIAELCTPTSSSPPLGPPSPWVLLLERGSAAVHVGWRIAAGVPAGGLGAPGQAPRRSYKGWLGKYALKSRAYASKVAMEPEIGFLIGNLARAGPGSVVLDPCCGSGGGC